MNAIEVKNLKKYFGKVKAVDDVSFEVHEGEIYGFLGPNGAGKTTTIRCFMDFIRPSYGSVTILGKSAVLESVALKKEVGFLSSDVHLYDNWTGSEHISFVEGVRGIFQSKNKLLERLSFDPETKVKHLSTGNKQKLGIILAFAGNPKLLILDELTRGLDPILQNEMYVMLQEFQKQGNTIFMSSHNLPEVEKICGRVAIIKNGKLVDTGDIETIRKRNVHLITVCFADKFSKDEFQLPDLEITQEFPGGLSFKARSDLNPLMQKLARHKLKDLAISHASLEDIFMEVYKK